MQELGWDRKDYVLCTKIFWGGEGPNDKGLSRKHIIEGARVRFNSPSAAFPSFILFLIPHPCLQCRPVHRITWRILTD